jgi:hypothetical protein
MRQSAVYAIVLAWTAWPAAAESLTYSINWASGLNLGEAILSSSKSSDPAHVPWTFDLKLDAGVPGFRLADRYHSTTNAELCTIRLEKDLMHGSRTVKEGVKFDQEKHEVARETEGGGKSEISTGLCARDALAFLQFVREELKQGRLAPEQTVIFGAAYRVRFDYLGVQRIKTGSTTADAEGLQITIRGPAANLAVDVFFARDAARTPLLARIPLPIGPLTVELVH